MLKYGQAIVGKLMSKNKMLMVTVAVLLAAVAVPVYAKTTKNYSTVVKPPAPTKPGSSFSERLIQRKAERHIKLPKVDIQRVRDRCIDAQTKVRVLSNTAATVTANHLNVYNTIDAKQWVMIGQIKLAGQDTFKLEKVRSVYVTKVAAYKATAGYYKQALGDLVLIKCQADPIGFQALLETSRLYYVKLQAQVADIRSYVVNQVKNTLDVYSNLLQTKLDSSRQ